MKKKLAVTIIFIVVLVFPMAFWPLLNYVENVEIYENRAPAPYPNTFDNECSASQYFNQDLHRYAKNV